jgi:AcrR family transcriptional regulator
MPVRADVYRQQVHDEALVAAEAMLVADGWDKLRFGDVAVAIGVSRPTLYASFANKEALGEALVRRETERFLLGIRGVLNSHPDPAVAIREATAFTLAEADRSPVLKAVLTSSHDGLLPFLTTRSRPLLDAASAMLAEWCRAAVPTASPADVADGVDALVRLVVSHLVLPAEDATGLADKLARVALAYLA